VSDHCFQTISQLYQGYRDGSLDPLAVMDAIFQQINRHEHKLHAYVRQFRDEALLLADAARQQIDAGQSLGPLTGVPIALKDLVDMEGRVTAGGSPARKDRISPHTASIAARLMRAGAIITGKTHTVEMAAGGWGTNEHMGTPWNPWDLNVHRVPGGSSSGSAVAVAAGFAAGAIGTDTGGSVRLPAAFCGLVGLKVTEGLLPLDGIIPLSPTLDSPGPMTRSVVDAALMFDVLCGRPPEDISTDFASSAGLYLEIEKDVKGLKLGVPNAALLDDCEEEVNDAFETSVALMEQLGAEIVCFDLPKSLEAYTQASLVIINAEGYHANKAILDDDQAVMDRWVRQRLRQGQKISADQYLDARETCVADRDEFQRIVSTIDGWLSPTLRTAAIPVTDVDHQATPGVTTRIANYLGLCGITVPNGFTASGLPLGLQIVCHPHSEAMALRIARAHEVHTQWVERRPVMEAQPNPTC